MFHVKHLSIVKFSTRLY